MIVYWKHRPLLARKRVVYWGDDTWPVLVDEELMFLHWIELKLMSAEPTSLLLGWALGNLPYRGQLLNENLGFHIISPLYSCWG